MKYFHYKGSQRRRCDLIDKLKDDMGYVHEASNYMRPFTDVEINEALFQMQPLKAHGSDDLSSLFFQRYWHSVGDLVVTNVLQQAEAQNLVKGIKVSNNAPRNILSIYGAVSGQQLNRKKTKPLFNRNMDEVVFAKNLKALLLDFGGDKEAKKGKYTGTLADSIEKSDGCRLPETDIKCYTWSILEGLSHIHDYGFVHCDLKPENVLLVPAISPGSNFVTKIGDFGLAKRSAQKNKRMMDLNVYLRGTPLYMAPEAVNENVQEPPYDIWALGCLVCEMLIGKSPWDREEELNAYELLQLIGDEREVPKMPSGVSDEAKSFLKSSLVRKPTYRFTAEMLVDHPFLTRVGDQLEDEYLKNEEHEVACISKRFLERD
ncbi:hypothetical protein F2P56_014302 [Juglans regia]|uniref:Calcium/calmodulin-dependent protein kinase cmkB-like n=2 Tax=Juglans regia TaxID=51240 RepID=A0A2I4G5F0_JUGRE|nr:calcium/calmodulin-dependent protein kinase cmkB-like [Juglans regia]KAF5464209.1 hypothetical protein F2P56_014302 [Juglans regia]